MIWILLCDLPSATNYTKLFCSPTSWPPLLASLLFLVQAKRAPTSRPLRWLLTLPGHPSFRNHRGSSFLPISHLCSNVISQWDLPSLPALEPCPSTSHLAIQIYISHSIHHFLICYINYYLLSSVWVFPPLGCKLQEGRSFFSLSSTQDKQYLAYVRKYSLNK